jgi:hemoglobin-like flavoprotein
MDPAKVQLVRQSLGRCLLNRALDIGFLDAFYDAFLASDPRIKPLFSKTDMETQKDLLRHGLTMLIMYGGGSRMARSAVEQLAVEHDHDHLNIEPGLYRLWTDSLLACVRKYDPKCDEGLVESWSEVLGPGIAVMTRAY